MAYFGFSDTSDSNLRHSLGIRGQKVGFKVCCGVFSGAYFGRFFRLFFEKKNLNFYLQQKFKLK